MDKRVYFNLRDMIDGTLTRMMVTNSLDELDERYDFAKKELLKLYSASKDRIKNCN